MAYIAIVDDDLEIAENTSIVLKSDGHETVIYTDTDVAISEMKKRKPDLLVLDVMFPENPNEGFDFARKLSKEIPKLRILMLSAVNSQYDFKFSSADIDEEWMPVSEFMEKPVVPEKLKSAAKRLLAK